jgi:pimeloyl-ACP methyl ester carboxylesterase
VWCRRWLRRYAVRSWRGITSAAAGLALPLGGWWLDEAGSLGHPDQLARGLVVVLPGIEGRGVLGWNICQGIKDAGFPGAVFLWDWTTGLWPLLLLHLRAGRWNRRKAAAFAQVIVAYQDNYPGRPIYLVGHSGGAAVAAWVMEALPAGRVVSGAVMLGAAASPSFPLAPALKKVQQHVWHFWSPLDLPLLGVGSVIFGTADGRHVISAGLCGFCVPQDAAASAAKLYRTRLRQCRYHPGMVRQFHLGGHFGWANRVFVAEVVAPLLVGEPCRKSA